MMNICKIIHFLPHFLKRHKVVKLLLFLSPNSRIQLIRFNGSAKLYADLADPFTRSYFFAQGFEPEFFSIARPFLSNGGVFFDVGANFGFCSFGLMGCIEGNDVEYHLFEANAGVCELLSRSAKLYEGQNIRVNHCCVTDNPGVSRLKVTYNNFGSSFISDEGTQEVINLMLDNYIFEHSIKKINFLKIDVEGWEVRVLKGAMNSLTAGIVDTIYMEASTLNLSRAGFSAEDCFSLLRDAGFYLFYVKRGDFESGMADRSKAFKLDVSGTSLTVAKVENFPTCHLTDILAIHRSSQLLRDYRSWKGER